MGIFDMFPYSNFHELNLSWLLEQVKTNINDIKTNADLITLLQKNFDDLKAWCEGTGLSAEVTAKLLAWKTDGTLEAMINITLQSKYDKLKFLAVNITDYGAHSSTETGYENFDNHAAIIAAFEYAKANKIGAVLIPSGVWKTTGLDLTAYSYIDLIGVSSTTFANLFDKSYGTVISFLPSTIDYGVLLDDNLHIGDAYNRTHGNAIRNIYFDCNHTIKYGIQVSFACIIENVFVTNAVFDGIVLGECSYPVTLKNVFSDFNGRHGVYVMGGMTTVYFMQDSEFYGNDGFGLAIDGGANARFCNLTIQSNGAGGVKIYYPNLVKDHYLQNLLFENVYTENCGTLDSGNDMYCGNPALLMDSAFYGTDAAKCAKNITFINCSFNQSTNGKSAILKAGYNVSFDGGLSLSGSTIDNTSALQRVFYPIGMDSKDINVLSPNRNYWKEIWSGTAAIGTAIDLYLPSWCSKIKVMSIDTNVVCSVDVDIQSLFFAGAQWQDIIVAGVGKNMQFRIERMDSDYHYHLTSSGTPANAVPITKILGQW